MEKQQRIHSNIARIIGLVSLLTFGPGRPTGPLSPFPPIKPLKREKRVKTIIQNPFQVLRKTPSHFLFLSFIKIITRL